MQSTHQIFVGDNGCISVSLRYDVTCENDSFDHEFGTEELPDYYLLNEVTWDDSEHTDLENAVIQYYIKTHWIQLEEEASTLASEQADDYKLEKAISRAGL